jgi:hypothetical protein
MDFSIEPSPRGGYFVRLAGHPTPISHHDTEEEANTRVDAYRRGALAQKAAPEAPRFQGLADGTQVLVRSLEPGDEALLEGLCQDRSFLAEIDHVDREAVAAFDPRSGEAVALVRYTRRRDDDRAAVVVCSILDAWGDSGVERLLRRQLSEHAAVQGIDLLM